MRLELTGKTAAGRTVSLPPPFTLKLDADRYIPCDALDVVLPLETEGELYCEMAVKLDGKVVFNGIADRQTEEKSGSGRRLKLECRSRTALLLDNEVKPYVYFQLTSSQLFERYAAPCGILEHRFPFEAKKNFLQVKKGWSHWRVIEEYCKQVYGTAPFVSREGVLLLNPQTGVERVLSNRRQNGQGCTAIQVQYRNDKLISRLYMKTATENYGYYYGVVIDNPVAQARRVRRERYHHPAEIIPAYAKSETQQIIDQSNREGFRVVVTVPGLFFAEVGDRIRLPEEKLDAPLLLTGLSYQIGADGAATRLTMTDSRY